MKGGSTAARGSTATRPGYLLSHRDTLLALAGALAGLTLAAISQTAFTTAAPELVESLGGLDQYSWVFTAYLLTSTVTVPVYGKLADSVGRRPIFVFALLVFLAGAGVGASAQSMTQVVVARAIQGIGAGALVPLAIIVIGDLVPASERGRWHGATAAVIGAASVLGPLVGGLITDHAHWRWVFLVSVPIGLWALVVGWITLGRIPRPERSGSRIDVVGAVLLTTGFSAGLLALTWGGRDHGWWSPHVSGGLALALGALLALVFHERRTADPLVPLTMLRDRTTGPANLAGAAVGAALFGTVMVVPLFVQGVLGSSATASGAVLTPLLVAMTAMSLISGRLVARTGRYRWALRGGPVLMLAAFSWLATLGLGSAVWEATAAVVVMGLGLGLLYQNIVLVVQNSVSAQVLGQATGLAQFSRQAGSTIGVAVLGAILAARVPEGAGRASPQALADAIHPLFLLGIPMTLAALGLLALVPERPLGRTVGDEPAVAPTP